MFSVPDYFDHLSVRLSEVLEEIGVNESIVLKRRRTWMLQEAMMNLHLHISNVHLSKYLFGSQTEGSTTQGLASDVDYLTCNDSIRLIQDWDEWQAGHIRQLLMVQDESTFPGYCLLQLVSPFLPYATRSCSNENYTKDRKGRILARHRLRLTRMTDGRIRHGPAATVHRGPGGYDSDNVGAIGCLSWPKQAEPWLQQQHASGWPTEGMKQYSAEHGCFVVPVCSRTGVYQDLEWRISVAHAERCLMFSLNVTQIRCYVLLKMILKTFINPKFEDTISSFMCKTVLFHCISNSVSFQWKECTLMEGIKRCLQALVNCVSAGNCPHFIIPENNLLFGKLSTDVTRKLLRDMNSLMENMEQNLLGIPIDDLGSRLYTKSSRYGDHNITTQIAGVLSVHMSLIPYVVLNDVQQGLMHEKDVVVYQRLEEFLNKIYHKYMNGNQLEKAACKILTPFFCTMIASVKASADIGTQQDASPEALRWFSIGLNSDFSSGRLKLASAQYSAGDLERCELVLSDLEQQLQHMSVVTVCGCYTHVRSRTEDLNNICSITNEDFIQNNCAFCVRFLLPERKIVPSELQCEMFRSTKHDKTNRSVDCYWMDWAVVDSLPYLYFLQYKVYSELHRPEDKHRALRNLARVTDYEPNLSHRETALNLLGLCMEQEYKERTAFLFYINSLRARRDNNVAKLHICRLISRWLFISNI